MYKGIIVLADGFETVEALATHDILLRSKQIKSELVGLDGLEIVSSNNTVVKVNKTLDDINEEDYDFICLPGGKIGVDNLAKSPELKELLFKFYNHNKLLAAICAAPSILGNYGFLDNKHYTCFPGFQKGNGIYENVGSVVDGKIITGHSMYYSIEFAEKIVYFFLKEEGLKIIYPGTRGI